jgi:predicted nucleic acid-binding protein
VYLIDTNVISEARKGKKANRGVQDFFDQNIDEDRMYLAVQSMGELRQVVEKIRSRGDAAQAELLENWLDTITRGYADKILDFDEDSAQVWGKLLSRNNQNPIDKQIAAIALIYDLTVVTRNVADFTNTGVRIINPWLVV